MFIKIKNNYSKTIYNTDYEIILIEKIFSHGKITQKLQLNELIIQHI